MLGIRAAMPTAAVRTLSRERDPLELFRIVSGEPLPVLLQSARRGPTTGRFSLVAADPFLILQFRQGRGMARSRRREGALEGDPLLALRTILDRYPVAPIPGIPFVGGAVGYLGYGLLGCAAAKAGSPASPWPDLQIALYDRGFVVDHVQGCTHLVASGYPETTAARRREKRRLDLERLTEQATLRGGRNPASVAPPSPPSPPEFTVSPEKYLARIRRAQEYISAGDIYQVNLSHRIRVEGEWRPWALYRELRDRHPASFAAYLPFRDHAVLCASPERLVRLSGRRAETRPIKGTRPRAADPAGDAAAAGSLATAGKERSENVMIVDLARNDLGRVCVAGSVTTEEICRVETLPTVHHLVSTVSGTLRPECDRIDLVRALFPGGSMTGAPKIRAMEIIEELEDVPRGIYSGSLGYFSFDGDLDLNIVIRTLIVSGRSAQLQVGGAILAESDPRSEYQETLDKARPLLDVLEGRGRS